MSEPVKPSWVRMPTQFGWWFFTTLLEDWDLARPVTVTRVESGGDVRFEAKIQGKTTSRITPIMGYWFGPIVVDRPPEG